jgi:hypothetical protein
MAIGRRKKYSRHPRRYKKELSNENGGDPTPPAPPLTLHKSPQQSSTSTSCQPLPSLSPSPCRSTRLSSPPMTKMMKRDDEADEMQWRHMISGYYRLVINDPPEKGYMAHDKFPGWEGDDGIINHIQQHFGLEQGRRTKIRRIVHSINEYSNRGCTYRGQHILGAERKPLVTSP